MSIELRRARADDADFLLELITDEDTRPFLGGRAGETREDVVAEIERSEREPDAFGWFVFEVDGEPVGCVAFHRSNERHRIAEAGRFAIHPRLRGRGIGIAAARAFQRHLLVDLDFHRVELQIYGFNERATRARRALRLRARGREAARVPEDGEWQDAVVFSLLQEELPPSSLPRMTRYLHTMYRITDPAASRAFYEALGFEFRRDMDIVRNGEKEATNYFFGVPGQDEELELTFNHDGRTYELGTGYGHIALAVDDMAQTLASLKAQGIEPEREPYSLREGGSLLCFVQDPDGYRIELIERKGSVA